MSRFLSLALLLSALVLSLTSESRVRGLSSDEIVAVTGSDDPQPAGLKCKAVPADGTCQAAYGTPCTDDFALCVFCETPTGTTYLKCVPGTKVCNTAGPEGSAECGPMFVGYCVPIILGVWICIATEQGDCGSIANACKV